MSDFPTGDPHCPECRGEGVYRGLNTIEPCRTCGKKEGDNADIEDALKFGDLVEALFPGSQDYPNPVGDPIQDTLDAVGDTGVDLSDPKWDDGNDGSELKTYPPVPNFAEWHRRWWEQELKHRQNLQKLPLYIMKRLREVRDS